MRDDESRRSTLEIRVIEITRFRLVSDVREADFLQADRAVQEDFAYLQPGLKRRTTARATTKGIGSSLTYGVLSRTPMHVQPGGRTIRRCRGSWRWSTLPPPATSGTSSSTNAGYRVRPTMLPWELLLDQHESVSLRILDSGNCRAVRDVERI